MSASATVTSMNEHEIPAAWVADYIEPDHDEYLSNIWEEEIEQREYEEAIETLRFNYYQSVM